MEPSKHFDEQIKKRMQGLESTNDSGAWDLFEQKLGEAEADDLFRERLENVEAPAQPGAWEAMQQLIEADEAAETIEQEVGIDTLVQGKFSNFEVPFQSHHWSLMAHRLEEEFTLRKQIYQFKAIELSLMALLLLTFVRFLPILERVDVQPVAEVENSAMTTPSDQDPIAQLGTGHVAEEEQKLEDVGKVEAQVGNTHTVSDNAQAETVFNEDGGHKDFIEASKGGAPIVSTQFQVESNSIDQLPLPSVSFGDASPNSLNRFVERNMSKQRILLGHVGAHLNRLAVNGPSRLKSKFTWEELPVLNPKTLKKQRQLRFSIFTSNDVNYVTTPADQLSVFDTTVATSAHNTLAAGYGGGILFSWKHEKMEFQTGGIYSFKRYMPNTPVFLFQTLNYYIKEDFNGIQLDILQVPLSMNYHFKDHGKWRFYGSAGVAGNFVTASVYEIESEQTEAFDPLNPPSGPDDFRTLRKEIEFPDGLADGGDLRDNLYVTLNAGIGVERYLSPKWVIFFQPNYQHYMLSNGVGANNDKIYSTSLYLGAKFSLK